jgi:hypothetical protein
MCRCANSMWKCADASNQRCDADSFKAANADFYAFYGFECNLSAFNETNLHICTSAHLHILLNGLHHLVINRNRKTNTAAFYPYAARQANLDLVIIHQHADGAAD